MPLGLGFVTGDPNLAGWTLAVAVFAALTSMAAFVVAPFCAF